MKGKKFFSKEKLHHEDLKAVARMFDIEVPAKAK
jgi:hypothetical protein